MRGRVRPAAALVVVAGVLLTACTGGVPEPARSDSAPASPSAVGAPGAPAAEVGAVALTAAGAGLAADTDWAARPAYEVDARIDPESGRVSGTWRVAVPLAKGQRAVDLRWFPGLADVTEDARLGAVTVDGAPAKARVQDALVTVRLPSGTAGSVRLAGDFTYTARDDSGGSGSLDPASAGLDPADVGLLKRYDDGLNLGHWLPLVIPPGGSAEPVPDGFGDLGNFEAGSFRVRLDVPVGWTVVTGGVRTGQEASAGAGRHVVVEEGRGLRDLSVVMLREVTERTDEVAGTTVRVIGPADDPAAVLAVLAESVRSVETLSAAFGPYPWRELDVVAAPLGAGVGGMEWPGVIWISDVLFGGEVPGLDDLADLEELRNLNELGDFEDFEELLGEALGQDLGGLSEMFRDGPLASTLDPAVLSNLRYWTVAHEVGHEWWHALVGNDSLLSPSVDEPLAQYSACLVMRADEQTAADADAICEGNMAGGYAQMRVLGGEDAAAAQASDDFEDTLQYAGLVYGKAPEFYRALEAEYGAAATQSALRALVDAGAFALLTPGQVRDTLGRQLRDPAGVSTLWQRWFDEAHGDDDLGVSAGG